MRAKVLVQIFYFWMHNLRIQQKHIIAYYGLQFSLTNNNMWPVVRIWLGHRGYTPTLYEKCHGISNDHRESGPRFNVSSERQCFFTV